MVARASSSSQNSMSVIFLNVEGVLANRSDNRAAPRQFSKVAEGYLMALIKKVGEAKVGIVITDPLWEHSSKELFAGARFVELIIDKTGDSSDLGYEVRKWLEKNKKRENVENFVIIGSYSPKLSPELLSHYVFVDARELLTEENADNAFKILTSQSSRVSPKPTRQMTEGEAEWVKEATEDCCIS